MTLGGRIVTLVGSRNTTALLDTWTPLGPGNIGDPHQPDVMFAGTGKGYFREEIRGTGLPLRGHGIFVTHDGGNRWARLQATESADFHWVNDLELGIGDSRTLYAATRTGVWRSRDRGESWTRLLETSVRGGCLELAIRPDHSDDTLFASCGSYEQATVFAAHRSRATTRGPAMCTAKTACCLSIHAWRRGWHLGNPRLQHRPATTTIRCC